MVRRILGILRLPAGREAYRAWLIPVLGVVVLAVASCGGSAASTGAAGALMARQTADSCEAPPLPPATLTPFGENPLPGVTLVPEPSPGPPQGRPSEAVANEVTAAARNFVNCWNERNWEKWVALSTVNFFHHHFVLESNADILVTLSGTPSLHYIVRSLEDPERHDDGRVSIAIEYTWVHQEIAARWYFTKGSNGYWLLDQEVRIPIDLGVETSTINLEMTEYGYTPATPTVKATPGLRINFQNKGGLPHEVFLAQVTGAFDPTTLFQPGVQVQGGVEFFGHQLALPGQSAEITTTGLKPGQYVFVCQFRYPGGAIHSQRGMVGLLTVE